MRIRPTFLSDHVQLNYKLTFQEFIAPGSQYSFNRFTADFAHDFPIYGNLFLIRSRPFNGPDECRTDPQARKCPPVAKGRDVSGSIGLRFVYSESFVSAANAVPFYFQPTLGGTDMNGTSYCRVIRITVSALPIFYCCVASFEHSIWGPLGFLFMADEGKVALTHSELDFTHLKHSFATGLTLRAGGVPAVSLLFAWGGNEGTHTILYMDTSLLGGSARPSLY